MPRAVGSGEAAREGCVRPCCVARKPASESRAHPNPEERVASRMVAPSAGEARKCHPAGSGSEKWAQMVLFTPISSQGLGTRAAGLESAAVTEAGQGRRGVSFSSCFLEGCGPRPFRALSMVRGAAECGPALLASLLPESCSPLRPLLGLSGPLVPFPFLGFLLLFFFCWSFFPPFPHSPVLHPPPRLS